MESIRDELLGRYESTGRIGLIKPKNIQEAYNLIDTLVTLYETDNEEENSYPVISLKELTEKMKNFFEKF